MHELDVANFLAWFAGTQWQLYLPTRSSPGWYLYVQSSVASALPPSAFGITWFLVYSCMAVGSFLYDRNCGQSGDFSLVVSLMLANVLLNKMWTVAFFLLASPIVAFIIILLLLASAVVIVIFCTDEAHDDACDGSAIAASVLWSVNVLWVLFATILNASSLPCCLRKKNPCEDEQSCDWKKGGRGYGGRDWIQCRGVSTGSSVVTAVSRSFHGCQQDE